MDTDNIVLEFDKSLQKRAAATIAAKSPQFKKIETALVDEYWRPEIGQVLRGVYLGVTSRERSPGQIALLHRIGTLDDGGKPRIVGVNGSAALTRLLKLIEVGVGVSIVYKGFEETKSGRQCKVFDVGCLSE